MSSFVPRDLGVPEKKILKGFTIYWHSGYLSHVTLFIHIYIVPPFIQMLPTKFDFDWPSGFRI